MPHRKPKTALYKQHLLDKSVGPYWTAKCLVCNARLAHGPDLNWRSDSPFRFKSKKDAVNTMEAHARTHALITIEDPRHLPKLFKKVNTTT